MDSKVEIEPYSDNTYLAMKYKEVYQLILDHISLYFGQGCVITSLKETQKTIDPHANVLGLDIHPYYIEIYNPFNKNALKFVASGMDFNWLRAVLYRDYSFEVSQGKNVLNNQVIAFGQTNLTLDDLGLNTNGITTRLINFLSEGMSSITIH